MGTNGYPPAFRKKVLWSMFGNGMTASQAASEHGISESTARKWYEEANSGTPLPEVVENLLKCNERYKDERERRLFAEKVMEHFAEKYFEAKAG